MQRIYARKTFVKSVDADIAQTFVEKHHKSGSASPNTKVISIGLFYNDNLVAVAQFCTPRTTAKKREYTTELLRLCFKTNVQVIGGASKLIKFYIKKYNPADIFTYQDTTGKNTEVYEKCGFILVSQDYKKRYLVAPGKTFKNANKNQILSVAYAAKFGPDKILKTNLKEQFKKDGKRKTNIELFQDLGWNIETTSGDKVYEWVNSNRTYYTYKITATDSNKYYYGVSHVNIKNASFENCLKHEYMGSGGKWNKNNKFNNWKKKHNNFITKEIIQTFERKGKAYEAEKELINDLWKNDPLCLNSIPGGKYTGFNTGMSERITIKKCEIHGLTKHSGKTCAKCSSKKSIKIKNCSIHGTTKHIGNNCRKCIIEKNVTKKNCAIHGETKHIGDTCYQCISDKNVLLKECEIHGKTKYLGSTCQKCANDDLITIANCEIHGKTKHRAEQCSKCTVEKSITMKQCKIHGLTKHAGNTCCACTSEKSMTVKHCEIHGDTKHIGEQCRKCINEKNVSLKNCIVHGLAKHIGEKCYQCRDTKYVLQICENHGETYFVNNECLKCRESIVGFKECPTHGLTKHMGDKCSSCYSQNSINMKECSIHGLTKHKGKSCSKCTADKGAHRHHVEEKGKTKKDCSLCIKEISEGLRKPIVEKSVSYNECQLCHKSFVAKNKNQLFCSNPHTWECAICKAEITPVPRKGKTLYSCFAHRREVSLLN